MDNEIREIIRKIRPVLTRYGIDSASIVGSFAHGDQTGKSDVDIVVDITEPMSLLTFSTLKTELEELLHRKVDLLERSAIKERLKKFIFSKEIRVA